MVNDEESTWASFYLNNGSFNVLENQPHPIEKVDLSTLRDYMLFFNYYFFSRSTIFIVLLLYL